MSESGFSGLPPGPRTGDVSFPQSIAELKAQIIEARAEIKTAKIRQKLEGEILRHNKDGTTTIRTDKGDVTVQLRGRDRPPEGAKVEIEIPPGRPPGSPPRQVIVRPAPEQTAQPPPSEPVPAENARPSAQPPSPSNQDTAAARPEARPEPPPPLARLDVKTAEDLARHVAALPKEQRVAAPLKPDDLIRLIPLPAADAARFIASALEIIQARLTPLPVQPQISLSKDVFKFIHPHLTLPRAEHAQLQFNLPHPLPLFTPLTAEPVPAAALEKLPLAARSPVTQLLQTLLQATGASAGAVNANTLAAWRPFEIPPSPVLISPPSFAAQPVSLPLAPGNVLPVLLMPEAAAASKEAPVFIQTFFSKTNDAAFFKPGPVTEGKILDIRIRHIMPPPIRLIGGPAPGAPENTVSHISAPAIQTAMPGALIGTITGMTPQNLPVISFYPLAQNAPTAPHHFVMQFQAANLPAGTRVEVMPLSGTAGPLSAAPLAPFIPFPFFSDFSWPAMEDLARALQQAPQGARLLQNIAANPATPSRLPAAALFFIAAVRSGDITNWLGDKTIDTLRRLGKGDVINRLARDVGGLQRTGAEQAGQDWRATALPMMEGGDIHKMMLYYRHDRDDDQNDNENKKRGTRFIFDLNLNRMGDVQLDGLYRTDRLDLILRTRNKLSQVMQQTMRRAYVGALEQTGITGELSFQNKPEQFVKVEMPKRSD